MSLYNAVHGHNPLAGIVLAALGLTPNDVPRLRDAWFDAENDRLVVYTRTGGGNRDYYDTKAGNLEEGGEGEGPFNEDLRDVAGFLSDEDDDFDSTYASFYYSIPDRAREVFDTLKEVGAGRDPPPKERWEALLEGLRQENTQS